MNVLGFLSVLILVITIITLVFGVIAYFLYKAREKTKYIHKFPFLSNFPQFISNPNHSSIVDKILAILIIIMKKSR